MRTDPILLQDMLDAIGEVIENTPADRDTYNADKFLRSHLVRNIQIIGEAAVRLSKELRDANPQVPWRQIAGMRHAIVHDYFQIDWNEVYDTAVRDIPPLNSLIADIIAALPETEV
ncbi:MAG: DUF86 domain-containing protein [Candidatus Hydrogenedentes bacterium]|nr:DUF86 domain-containing protein [Candidatus Hydrogenedentota bacterium]